MRSILTLPLAVMLFAAAAVSALAQSHAAPRSAAATGGACVWDEAHDLAPCIQAQIDAASAKGGTVRIRRGTWRLNEPLTLKANVTLMGDGPDVVLAPTKTNQSKPVLLSGNPKTVNVLIKNITFDGGGPDFANPQPLVLVWGASKVIFDDVTVRNSRGMAIVMQAGTHDSGVRNSHFINIGNHWKTTLARPDRIQALVFCCRTGNVNNFATGNTFKDIGLGALLVDDQQDFLAADNDFDMGNNQFNLVPSRDYGAAIFTMYSRGVTITRNKARGVSGTGIDAPGLQDSVISHNTIIGSGCSGIGLFRGYDKVTEVKNVTITDNYVANSHQWPICLIRGGIEVFGGRPDGVTIEGNVVTDTQGRKTQVYGLQVRSDIEGLKIGANNKFSGNAERDIDRGPSPPGR